MFARLFALCALSFFSLTANAVIGTIDNVPAATLLFPHFEVDTQSDSGPTTIISVQNASATAILVNVVLWTDYGLPTGQFDVYLTGYDQQVIDLRSLLRRVMPRTASAGQDPTDTISNQGPISQDINFASCNGFLNSYQNGSILSRGIVGAHTGQPSADYFGGQCGAKNYGDGIARGYVTMDTTNQCTIVRPGAAGYFVAGGSGIATNQNVLSGDYTIVYPALRRSVSDLAVHIEASATDPLTSAGPNKQTFYGRLIGYGAADNREPLPTAWAAKVATGRSDVDYWRDPGVPVAPFACASGPAVPAGQRQVAQFNIGGTQTGAPVGNLFPFATGTASGASLGISEPLGWLFANLNLSAPSGPYNAIRQSWLSVRQVPRTMASGGPSYQVPGIQLGNAANADDPTVP